MNLAKALKIADATKSELAPHCERIEIAGSIRRQRPEVGDIEIVCIPKMEEWWEVFFDSKLVACEGFRDTVNKWEKVRGEPTGKYTQRILPGGIKLDLFMATEQNWGLIYAIRTGSSWFSHKVLATEWVKQGYKSNGGMLIRQSDNKITPIESERQLFKVLALDWVEPENREESKWRQ